MKSVNEMVAEQALSHAVDLQQYNNSVVRRLITVLNRTNLRLFAELSRALESIDPSSFTVERLESMLYSVRAINREGYGKVAQELTEELRSFVEYESAYQRSALVSVLPVQVSVAAISAETVYAAALARPFQGVLLRAVLDDMEAATAKKIRQTIAQGFVESKTTAQIVRELRGTQAKGYSDGLMEGSRRGVETIARTALGHMAGFTHDRFVEANADIIKAVVWSATLDLRTTEICRVRDGKSYTPVTHKPVGHSLPWLSGPSRSHWRCRSHQTAVLKSFKELGIDVPEIEVEGRTRASLDGQVPAKLNYADWLKKQSLARQIQVLGPTRAKLMRDGNLPLEAMYSQKGLYKTLDQIRVSDAAAFTTAGL